MATVTAIGTPSPQGSSGSGTPRTRQGAWGTGQDQAAGDLLIALVTASGSTSAGTTSQASGTTGWTKEVEFGGTYVKAAIWSKPATGSETAPTFQSTISGTSARCHMSVTLYQLHSDDGTLPVIDTKNTSGAGTTGTLTITTAANIAAANEFAVACECMQASSASTNTWGAYGSWTKRDDGTASSTYFHWAEADLANPASGTTLSWAPSHSQTSTGTAGVIAAFKPGIFMSIGTGQVGMKKMTVAGTGAGISVASMGSGLVSATFDSVGPSNAGVARMDTNPLAWTHTIVNGPATLIIAVGEGTTGDAGDSFTCTVDGSGAGVQPLGSLLHIAGGSSGWVQTWYKTNVDTGAHSISVTSTDNTGDREGGSVAFSTAGTPTGIVTSQSGLSISRGGTPSTSVVFAFLDADGAIGAISSGVERFKNNYLDTGSPGWAGNCAAGTAAGGGAGTVSWASGGSHSALIACEVPGAGGGAGFGMKKMTISGTGGMPEEAVATGDIRMKKMRIRGGPFAPYITSLAGVPGTGYFQDQNNNPRFFLCDAGWGLIPNAGEWGGFTWQQDIDYYLQTRADQGFTCVFCCPVGTTHSGALTDSGNTWDGVSPFTTPYTALNPLFWERVDYLIDQAAGLGITIVMNVVFKYCLETATNILYGINSGSNPHDYGLALGNRYKTKPNLIWHFGDDYDAVSWPAVFSGVIQGIRDAGDTHEAAIENTQAGSTSRYMLDDPTYSSPYSWGSAWATYQWCYYYGHTYFAIEYAYGEPSPLPVIQGDGMYWGEVGDTARNDQAMRYASWWAISSGARGYSTAQVDVHLVPSTWRGSMADGSWFSIWAKNIRTLMESLPDWHLLKPDTSSQLITAGRGTRSPYVSAGQSWYDFSNNYVSASKTPSGTLAVIFMTHASTITIDETKMVPGYQAFRVDPATCTKTEIATGSSYNSGSWGNNSVGQADWVLVLQGAEVELSVITGNVSSRKMRVSGSGTGFSDVSGGPKLKKAQIAGSGSGISIAASAIALKKTRVSASGSGISVVTGNAKLKKTTISGAGSVFIADVSSATIAVNTKKMVVTGAGSGVSVVSGGPRLKKTAVSGTGSGTSVISGGPRLKKMAVSGAGTKVSAASGAISLKKMKIASTGTGVSVVINGPTLKKMVISGSGSGITAVSGGPRMKKMTIFAFEGEVSLVTASVKMDKMSVAGTGTNIAVVSGGPIQKKMRPSGTGAGISVASGGSVLKRWKVFGTGAGVSTATGIPSLKRMVVSGTGAGISDIDGAVRMKKMTIYGSSIKIVESSDMFIFSLL